MRVVWAELEFRWGQWDTPKSGPTIIFVRGWIKSDYHAQRRGGKGVIAIQTSERNGKVIGANQVNENDELMFISSSGNLIRTKINSISVIGRNTQGVKLIRLSNDDKLLGMERIINDDDEEQ